MKQLLYTLLFGVFFILACTNTAETPLPTTTPESAEVIEESKTIFVEAESQFKKILAKESGNVVLVNLWATWCKPCVYEMPSLEKLHKKYENKGLKVIALSLDEPKHLDSLVIPYWEENQFSMDYYVLGGEDQGAIINKIDPLWMGVIPTTYIFDEAGKLVESITGTQSFDGFQQKVLKAMK